MQSCPRTPKGLFCFFFYFFLSSFSANLGILALIRDDDGAWGTGQTSDVGMLEAVKRSPQSQIMLPCCQTKK